MLGLYGMAYQKNLYKDLTKVKIKNKKITAGIIIKKYIHLLAAFPCKPSMCLI